jgi:large subunit ribosomal protein L21
MFAVIRTGGKQYLVKPGQELRVETLDVKAGDTVTFDDVLLVADKDAQIGAPTLAGAKVTAQLMSHGRAKKVTGIKFHNKVRYTRTKGHRQNYSMVKIKTISAK